LHAADAITGRHRRFLHVPVRPEGKRIDIASGEFANVLSRVPGRPVDYEALSPDMSRLEMEDMALMFERFDQVGCNTDIKALKAGYPDVPWLAFDA